MRHNHGGLEPPSEFTDFSYTIDASFESAFTKFKASISFRDTMTTINNNLKNFNKFTTQIIKDYEDTRRHRRQSQSHSGNKRSKHTAHMRTIPSPRKRNKVRNTHPAKAAKTTTTKKGTPSRPEDYRFIVRNTTFPDPKNCMNFMPNQTGEKSPWSHTPTARAFVVHMKKHELDARATMMKFENPATRYSTAIQVLGETRKGEHYQAYRKPPPVRDKILEPTSPPYQERKHTRFKYIVTMTMTMTMTMTATRQPLIQSFFTVQRNEGVPKNTRTYTRRPPRQNQDEE
jgi:hypothetical protein